MKVRVAIIVLMLAAIGWAQTEGNPHVTKLLDNFATSCGVTRTRSKPQIFTPGSKPNQWRRMSIAKLEKCEECLQFALVLSGAGEKRVVQLENTSESGDWYQYVMYCYGGDGSLTRALSDINSAWDWAVVQEFNIENGKLSPMPVEYRSTATWKKLPRPVDPVDVDEFYRVRKPKMYRHLSEWPFYSLLVEPASGTNKK